MQRSQQIADPLALKNVPLKNVKTGEKRHVNKRIDQVDQREVDDENVWYSAQLFKMVHHEAN